GHAHVELALDEGLVGLITDEVAARKQVLPHLSLMQSGVQFFVAHSQTHAVGLVHQDLLSDQALRCPLHEVRHDLRRNVALELLLADEAGLLRHLRCTELLGADFRQHALGGQAAAEQVVEKAAAGDESDNHHHADDDQDAAQNDLLNGAGLLQETKHSLWTPE